MKQIIPILPGGNEPIDGRALNEKQNMALVAMAMMYTEPGKAVYVYGADGTDANGDGYEDLVLIGSADNCDHVNIFKYDEKRVGLFPDEEHNREIDAKLETTIDMDSVKALIEA